MTAKKHHVYGEPESPTIDFIKPGDWTGSPRRLECVDMVTNSDVSAHAESMGQRLRMATKVLADWGRENAAAEDGDFFDALGVVEEVIDDVRKVQDAMFKFGCRADAARNGKPWPPNRYEQTRAMQQRADKCAAERERHMSQYDEATDAQIDSMARDLAEVQEKRAAKSKAVRS